MPTTTRKAFGVDPQTVDDLMQRYAETRGISERLCDNMATEDYVIQSTADASPIKWHLAHVTWFFEAFILAPHDPTYKPLDAQYNYLFNSYYNAIGAQFSRPRRGHLSRPTVQEIYAYRHHVDHKMMDFLRRQGDGDLKGIGPLVILGLHHEQQHQELMATDIKHLLAMNPLQPTLYPRPADPRPQGVPALEWLPYEAGLYEIGYAGNAFHFDNEAPRHRVYVHAFELGSRLVTNAEYLAFMEDGGYQRPELWLSLGWTTVCDRVQALHGRDPFDKPLYWFRTDAVWMQYTLAGPRPVHPDEPVVHVSYYEADAYARWCGARLPSEVEWEIASADADLESGAFQDAWRFHPDPLSGEAMPGRPHQMFGEVWEWTASAYNPYPGFKPWAGMVGEYNGKFMANQMVLRGGSCATPANHIRPTYRNFFYGPDKWQFMGFRLARDAS